MQIPISWLQDFLETKIPTDLIVKTLTSIGIEVDGVETIKPSFSNVIVAQVENVESHPNAEKLVIATVFDGQKKIQVVCGAPNCRKGLITAFAQIGASITDKKGSFTIKKTSLRGIDSHGMLCSGIELGLNEDDEGLIVLNNSGLDLGTKLEDLVTEQILEVSLTPNLGHCLSIYGIARELAAALDLGIKKPKVDVQENCSLSIKDKITVKLTTSDCPRFSCRLMTNVSVQPSPLWMQMRLKQSGIRPINNIVDATNYTMLMLGHPLHAYDYDKLSADKKLIIKKLEKTASLTTLDNISRKLEADTLVICDNQTPIAIAGVMGGANSEVDSSTKNILLEAAYFTASPIRKASKELNLATDASKRFERGVDPNMTIEALNHVASLIQKISGGDIAYESIDIQQQEFPQTNLSCRLSQINRLLGIQLAVSEVEVIFHRLGLTSVFDGQDIFSVVVPTYRHDLNYEVDLIEEIARMYGYDNITTPRIRYSHTSMNDAPIYLFEKQIKKYLLHYGLQEFITCDLISPSHLEHLQEAPVDERSSIFVLNPNSIDHSVLRTSLMPGLLQVAKHNIDHQNTNLAGFEIGKIHLKENASFKEKTMASFILTGSRHPLFWEKSQEFFDYYDLKGILESIFSELGLDPNYLTYQNLNNQNFHPGRQASIFYQEYNLGILGEIHPKLLRKSDLQQKLLFAEIDLHVLFLLQNVKKLFTPVPQYPETTRDWTLTCTKDFQIGKLLQFIQKCELPLLKKFELLDIYQSEKLGYDKKNITLRLHYRNDAHTISYNEAEEAHLNLQKHVLNQFSSHIAT